MSDFKDIADSHRSVADTVVGEAEVKALALHFAKSGFSIADIGRISKIGGYQGLTVNRDTGEATIHDMHKWEISTKFADGPKWQPAEAGPAVKLPTSRTNASKKKDSDWKTSFIWPDTQIGYYRSLSGLEPTQDEAAISVALQLLKATRPDVVVRLGDDLDLPNFGKYRNSPAFAGTTQASIDRNTILGAQQRVMVGPDCEMFYIAGNHEERLSNYLLDNAMAAYGIRPGQYDTSAGGDLGWPDFSIPALCRLDEHAIQYIPGYPAGEVWLSDDFKAIHGHFVNARGLTATKYLEHMECSVVYGHIHRREYLARTLSRSSGAFEKFAASPGCLARKDGAVPSTKGGTDLDGRPILRNGLEDWQHGVGLAHSRNGQTVYENIPILSDGPVRYALWNGKEYASE